MHLPVKMLQILDSIDSTNNYAMGRIRDGVAHYGNAWLAYEQTQGKGRRGKAWKAEKGKNIMMSIAVTPDFLTLSQQFRLNVAVSLACHTVFMQYAGAETKIKWPNDIFWNDRKAGGILIENIIKGNAWQWSVIGIGININQTAFDVDSIFKPVSLKQITGKDFDVIELANLLYKNVMEGLEKLKKGGYNKMLAAYNTFLFALDKKVKLKKYNAVFETEIKGVSTNGKLLTADTEKREFDFDEVEWVR